MTMGEKILSLRKARGWSQEELAERIGVTRQAVSRWESGAAKPDTDKVIAVCDLFGVSADYLLRDSYNGGAGMPSAEAPQPRRGPLAEALIGLTLKQWTALTGFVTGLLTMFLLKLLSSVFPCEVHHFNASGWEQVSTGLWGFLMAYDLEWLWYLAFVASVTGGVVLFGRSLIQWIKKISSDAWDGLATFFNWNG